MNKTKGYVSSICQVVITKCSSKPLLVLMGVLSTLAFISMQDTILRVPPASRREYQTSTANVAAFMASEQYEVGSEEIVNECSPVDSVFFLKTHKTGSSTIFNILMRYADEHNRTVAFPRTRSSLMMYPRPLRSDFLLNYSLIERRPEFFTLHCRLDVNVAKSIMPPQAKFITILRSPAKLWESSYNYFRTWKITGLPLKNFIWDHDAVTDMRVRRRGKWQGFNQMFFDMGFNESIHEDIYDQALQAIHMLEKNFHLVLIAEFMEESLILLKRDFCWTLENIVVFSQNARNTSSIPEVMDDHTKNRLEQLNEIDLIIYEYFRKKLENRIAEFGVENMRREVNDLRGATAAMMSRCVSGYTHGFSQTIEYVLKNSHDSLCRRLTFRETAYTRNLKIKYGVEFYKKGIFIKL